MSMSQLQDASTIVLNFSHALYQAGEEEESGCMGMMPGVMMMQNMMRGLVSFWECCGMCLPFVKL